MGIWEWHLDTETVIYSDKYLEIFELPLGDYDHAVFLSKVHPDDIPTRNEAVARAMQTGHLHYEARIRTDDNRIKWYEAKGKLFYDHAQQPLKFIGTLRDITDAKTYQQELEARESEFRLLADTMPQLVWVSDKDGKVHFYNQRITEFAGVTQLPDGSWQWKNMVHPDDMESTEAAWKNAISKGIIYMKEHRAQLKNGEYRWHLSRAFPQKDSDGNITQWYGTATDIHEQKTFSVELEKQVQERTKALADSVIELEKMNKELQAFAYISSHDLQEPLRKIQTFADRIIEKEYSSLSDQAKDYFTRMQRSAGRMQALIDDLLVYSRTNTTERVFVNTDLLQIIEEIKDDLSEELKNKQATIETDIACNADIIPFQFRQLLYNFISNSLKFTRPDVPAHIVIKGKTATGSELNYDKLLPDSKYCHITVSDNGIGFDNKYSEKIFEVFQRLHGKGEYAGTGIGLAIVKKIVENHHGFITAHGEINAGATFEIYIPAL